MLHRAAGPSSSVRGGLALLRRAMAPAAAAVEAHLASSTYSPLVSSSSPSSLLSTSAISSSYHSSSSSSSSYSGSILRQQARGYFRPTAARLADDTGPFERYSEIDNSNEKRIRALKMAGLCGPKDEWIGTEKIHGANFGIYSVDYGAKIRYSKRSGLMPDSEHFFGYHCLIPELVTCIRKVRELVEQKVGTKVHTVIVNGELFGGKYDHPSVPKSRQTLTLRGKQMRISAVQTNEFPQYSPNLHFYAFDIKYKVDEADTGEAQLLTFDEATEMFEQVPGLLYAKAVVRGTMDVVAAFDVENFQTTLPALLGLGDFPLKGNWSEGLVVKHAKRGTIGWNPSVTTVLKFKTVAFQEISTDRKQGPRVDAMADVRRESIARAGVQLPLLATVIQKKEELEAAEYLLNHVCDNRLQNVLSKMGPEPFISQTVTPNEVATLLANDALKDFLKEAEESIVNGSNYLRNELCRYCLFESRKLVCKEWKTILKNMKEQHAASEVEVGADEADADASETPKAA